MTTAKILQFPTQEVQVNPYDATLAEMFKDLRTHEERAGYNGETDLVCTFTMDAKEWKRLQTKGALGGVYNRDLSNFLYRQGVMTGGGCSVNDTARASKGRKTIKVSFRSR